MSGTTIQDQLTELCAKMAEEKNPINFGNLVKEMTHLLAMGEMSRLLETASRGTSEQSCNAND
jgi:hypothetical protein